MTKNRFVIPVIVARERTFSPPSRTAESTRAAESQPTSASPNWTSIVYAHRYPDGLR